MNALSDDSPEHRARCIWLWGTVRKPTFETRHSDPGYMRFITKLLGPARG